MQVKLLTFALMLGITGAIALPKSEADYYDHNLNQQELTDAGETFVDEPVPEGPLEVASMNKRVDEPVPEGPLEVASMN